MAGKSAANKPQQHSCDTEVIECFVGSSKLATAKLWRQPGAIRPVGARGTCGRDAFEQTFREARGRPKRAQERAGAARG